MIKRYRRRRQVVSRCRKMMSSFRDWLLRYSIHIIIICEITAIISTILTIIFSVTECY